MSSNRIERQLLQSPNGWPAGAIVAFCVLRLLAAEAGAHPATGIVVDAKGRVFYVHSGPVPAVFTLDPAGRELELVRVPKLRAPHHLALHDGQLFVAADAGAGLWRIDLSSPSPTAVALGNLGGEEIGVFGAAFVIDSEGGAVFFAPRRNVLFRTGPSGTDGGAGSRTLWDGGRGVPAGGLAVAPSGEIYWTVGSSIYRLGATGESLEVEIVSGLRPDRGAGLAVSENALFVADLGGSRVLRIDRKGRSIDVMALCDPSHRMRLETPTGVALAPDGALLIREHRPRRNRPRIVRVDFATRRAEVILRSRQ